MTLVPTWTVVAPTSMNSTASRQSAMPPIAEIGSRTSGSDATAEVMFRAIGLTAGPEKPPWLPLPPPSGAGAAPLLHDPFRDHLHVLGHLADRGAHAALAHPVGAAEVELDAVRAAVVDPADEVVPGLGLRLDHERHDDGLVRVAPLDVGDLGEVDLRRAIADELDVRQPDDPTAVDVERAEPRGPVRD